MGRKKEKAKKGGGEEAKKSSGLSGCGGRAHVASQWGEEKSLKNAVIHCGFLEAFLTALEAEDAGLCGLTLFSKLETRHSAGSRLVEHGRELANGKKQGSPHYRSETVWEDGPASWMVKAKEAFIRKAAAVGQRELILNVGERNSQWAMLPGNDASVPYRRMKAVAEKLEGLGLDGASAMDTLESEAIEGKLLWLFQSMEAEDKRMKTQDESRKKAEAAAEAAKKAAEAQVKVRK